MATQLIHNAFAKAGVPLWVTPYDAREALRLRNYHSSVADELAEWMSRRLSMSFAAGYLGRKPLPIRGEDVTRQLAKMGYCEQNAAEIAGMMCESHPLLHQKGCVRRSCDFAHSQPFSEKAGG